MDQQWIAEIVRARAERDRLTRSGNGTHSSGANGHAVARLWEQLRPQIERAIELYNAAIPAPAQLDQRVTPEGSLDVCRRADTERRLRVALYGDEIWCTYQWDVAGAHLQGTQRVRVSNGELKRLITIDGRAVDEADLPRLLLADFLIHA